MSKQVLTGQKFFLGQYKLTPDLSSAVLDYSADAKDGTTYGNDTRINYGGIKSVQLQCNGFVDYANSDSGLFTAVGLEDVPITVAAQGGTEGDIAYFFKSVTGKYTPLDAAVGDMHKFTLTAFSRSALVRGQLEADRTAVGSSGNSDGRQYGAVSSTQTLYALLHVFNSSDGGTGDQTLDVVVESDDNSGFPSATSRITFTQITTSASYQWATLAGAITDDYFRATWTVAGSDSPSFDFAVLIGVL